jgi:hypothetical protein
MRQHGTGEPTVGAVPTRDGRMRRDISVPAEITHLTALAVTPSGAVVGDTVVLSDAAPIGDLRVLRFGPELRARFEWPQGAVVAVASWTPAAASDRDPEVLMVRCSRRAFFDGRGLILRPGYGAGTLAVRAAYGYEPAEVLALPVEVAVPSDGVPVHYRIRPRPGAVRFLSRRCEVVVCAESACALPRLLVVEARGRLPPAGPHDGKVIASEPGRRVEAGEAVVIPVDPAGRRASWVVCFVDADDSGESDPIVLVPPPTPELWRR